MASSAEHEKNEEIAVQLSLEEKASLDEIIKQAELSLESEEVLNQSLAVVAGNESLDEAAAGLLQFVAVAGVLRNQTKGPLAVMAEKIWAGYFVKKFPNPIGPVSTGGFAMAGKDRVEAAVVYYGKNKRGVDCGWLLGFVATKDDGKVYVDCGKKEKYIHINWGDIKAKIEHGSKIYKHFDKDTGTSVIATIQGKNGKYAVGAAFAFLG